MSQMEITAYEKAYLGKCKNYHMAGSLKREVWWKKTEKDGEVDRGQIVRGSKTTRRSLVLFLRAGRSL